MAPQREVTILLTVQEEISKVFPKIGRVFRAVKRDLQELKTPAGVVRVAFRNLRRAGRTVITTFRRIGSAVGRLRSAFLGLRSVIGVLFAAFAVGRGIRALRETVEQLDALAKTSDKLGILPERLAELRFAAEISGIAVNTFDLGLQRMVRRVSEAAQGTGEAQAALEELGLVATDLADSTPDEIFLAIARAMEQVEGEAAKVRLSFKLFDSEGVALKNTLALGADELERLFRQAKALGLTLDRDQLRIVERLNDAITTLTRAWQGLKSTLVISVAPVITRLLDDLTVFVVVLPKLIDNLTTQLREAFAGGATGREARSNISAAIRSLFLFMTDLIIEGVRLLVFSFVGTLIAAFSAFAPQLEALGKDIIFRISEGAFGTPVISPERRKEIVNEIKQLNDELRKEIDRFAAEGIQTGDPDRAILGVGVANLLDPIPVVRLRKQIKLLELELGQFAKVKAEAERSRLVFEDELVLFAQVMSSAFEASGDEIKKSGAAVLDAFKNLVDFDVAADPQLIKDLRAQIATVRKELAELGEFDEKQADSVEAGLVALEKLIELREAQAAGDTSRVAILQQEIKQTAELVQLRNNITKSGEAQSEQAAVLIGRLTDLQAIEREALAVRLAAQEQLDRVLEAERKLRIAIQDRAAAVELGTVTQQTAAAATDAQAAALRAVAIEARTVISALGDSTELQEFVRQIEDVVRNLKTISQEAGGIFAGVRAGFQDFITEATNQFQQFQSLTSDLLGTISSGFAGIFSGVIRGTQDVGVAFEQMLLRMLDRVVVFLTDQLIVQFLQLFTAEGVLGAAFQQFTTAIGVGGIGTAVTEGAAVGAATLEVGAETAEAGVEGANTVAVTANTTAAVANTTALGLLTGALSTAAGTLSALASGIVGGLTSAAATLDVAATALGAIITANTAALAANTTALGIETIVPFAGGGLVPGPRTDRDVVSARLTPGEYVLRREAAQWYGRSIMEALNRRLIPRSRLDDFGVWSRPLPGIVSAFATGGSVQQTAAPATGMVPAVVVADDGTMERLLAGGENAMLRFFEDHAPRISALFDRHRGLPS